MKEHGLVHVYTGNGKGKTTAALGLALRASGHGWKVHIVQFMKGRIDYGELKACKDNPNITVEQFGRPQFVDKDNPEPEDLEYAKDGLSRAKEVVMNEEYQIVVLDEINTAVDFNLIKLEDVLDLIEKKPEGVELVLTGRNANPEIVKIADYVTEMLEIKHPYQEGQVGRKGIEF
ncbi:MAG: cob(I)yrinic acid a,c-diamide adenosyltransferase [Methanobacteriota archaeon]|nr:MAG: cob(I)yrinic acid a,c-diamide adenosyltransferase [Euryarchaeota archaeon]